MGCGPHGQHLGPGRCAKAIGFDAGQQLLAVAEHHQRRTVGLSKLGHAGTQVQGDLELGFSGRSLAVPQQGLAEQHVCRQQALVLLHGVARLDDGPGNVIAGQSSQRILVVARRLHTVAAGRVNALQREHCTQHKAGKDGFAGAKG